MDSKDDGELNLLSLDHALKIGFMIADMADRVKAMKGIVPGAQANWKLILDGTEFTVTVAVASK